MLKIKGQFPNSAYNVVFCRKPQYVLGIRNRYLHLSQVNIRSRRSLKEYQTLHLDLADWILSPLSHARRRIECLLLTDISAFGLLLISHRQPIYFSPFPSIRWSSRRAHKDYLVPQLDAHPRRYPRSALVEAHNILTTDLSVSFLHQTQVLTAPMVNKPRQFSQFPSPSLF